MAGAAGTVKRGALRCFAFCSETQRGVAMNGIPTEKMKPSQEQLSVANSLHIQPVEVSFDASLLRREAT